MTPERKISRVCVPGGQELDELVCLLVRFVGGVFQVFQVVGGYKGQVSHAARGAAAAQAGGGRVGGGAEARVHHRRGLPLSQEIRGV